MYAALVRKSRHADEWLIVAVWQVGLFVDSARQSRQACQREGGDQRVPHLELEDRHDGGQVSTAPETVDAACQHVSPLLGCVDGRSN